MTPSTHGLALGDEILLDPEVVWDTVTFVPRHPRSVWALMSRLGLRGEGGAGYFLPKRVERWLPLSMRSIESDKGTLPRQLTVGEKLRDVPKDSVAYVVKFDDTSLEARAVVLESHWPKGLHYTWTLCISPSPWGKDTLVQTRTRVKNLRHPQLVRRFGPRADQWTMKLMVEG